MDNGLDDDNHRSLTGVPTNCCLVPSKSTGVASCCVQFVALICSALVAIYFFYQIGGLEQFGFASNSSLLHKELLMSSSLAPRNITDELLEAANLHMDMADDDPEQLFDFSKHFENTTLKIDGMLEIDVLELIRLSTLVYIGMAIIWALSLIILLISVKFESLDLIVLNAFILTVSSLYLFVHALFIVTLVFFQFQEHLGWRSIAIVLGSVIVLAVCIVVAGFGLALLVGWYRYVVYMTNSERWICLGLVTKWCKKSAKKNPAQEYAMPEITRSAPYSISRMERNFSDI